MAEPLPQLRTAERVAIGWHVGYMQPPNRIIESLKMSFAPLYVHPRMCMSS